MMFYKRELFYSKTHLFGASTETSCLQLASDMTLYSLKVNKFFIPQMKQYCAG